LDGLVDEMDVLLHLAHFVVEEVVDSLFLEGVWFVPVFLHMAVDFRFPFELENLVLEQGEHFELVVLV